MEEKKANAYIQTIGDFLLKQVEINRNVAESINNGTKTIEKSLKEVEVIAKKKAVKGCAVMSDIEVFGIVKKYYGFEAIQDKMLQVEIEEIKEDHQIQYKVEKRSNVVKVDFNTNLEDYL
nr:Cas9 inhibitor AcrIIA9 family protein [Clostridium gasigenes]